MGNNEMNDMVNGLIERLKEGNISLQEVQNEIDRISKEQGENAFNSYVVKKHSAPWTKEDLDELRMLSVSGAKSKEFILYWAEVNDYLKRKDGRKNPSVVIAIAVVAAILLIIAILKALG